MEFLFLAVGLVLALVSAFFGLRPVEGRLGWGFFLALALASFIAAFLVGKLPT